MRIFLCIATLFLFAHTANAVSDDFVVTSLVGNDLAPPTVPTNVSATAVTTAQIDVAWDASSDNFAVGGYQVFRDSVQIATTTLSSYSDTGLVSSTTYAYTVRAFDTSFNFSTSSATATATTLAVPIVNNETPSSGTRIIERTELVLGDIQIEPELDLVKVNFSTNFPTQAVVAWGRTSDFELGFSSGAVFKEEHQILISDLLPGSVYEIRVEAIDSRGRTVTTVRQFTTSAGEDTVPPANPLNFQAVPADEGIQLSWENPSDVDFEKIRIVSSDQFYPTDTRGGYLVFDGIASDAIDSREFDGVQRFYTIFAYDQSGNVSSGAVTEIFFSEANDRELDFDTTDVLVFDPDSEAGGEDSGSVFQLGLNDISFTDQSGRLRYMVDNSVSIGNNQTTRISVPYEKLPEHLKTIIVRLTHPEDGSVFSFLLKVNADKTAYEARIGALTTSGIYSFSFEVFDFKVKEIQRLSATVEVVEVISFSEEVKRSQYVWLIWLLPLLMILYIAYRRLRH